MGRPKGSKNKKTSSLTDELLDELREQEEDFVSKDNHSLKHNLFLLNHKKNDFKIFSELI